MVIAFWASGGRGSDRVPRTTDGTSLLPPLLPRDRHISRRAHRRGPTADPYVVPRSRSRTSVFVPPSQPRPLDDLGAHSTDRLLVHLPLRRLPLDGHPWCGSSRDVLRERRSFPGPPRRPRPQRPPPIPSKPSVHLLSFCGLSAHVRPRRDPPSRVGAPSQVSVPADLRVPWVRRRPRVEP